MTFVFRMLLPVLTLAVTACAGPAPTPTPVATREPPPTSTPAPNVTYGGISFSYDDTLAREVVAETIAAVEPGRGDPQWRWANVPERVQFSFNGYVLPDRDPSTEPRIYVYPVSQFEAINPHVPLIIADLRQLLVEKPATAPGSFIYSCQLPFLPLFGAQIMRAQLDYLDFQNGTGIRFLTQYAQNTWPIDNHLLFYTFQGLTHDGGYYVSAILPVSNPILPAHGSAPVDNAENRAFVDNFNNYVRDIGQQLGAQPASTFTPDLSLLDAMIRSLLIEKTP